MTIQQWNQLWLLCIFPGHLYLQRLDWRIFLVTLKMIILETRHLVLAQRTEMGHNLHCYQCCSHYASTKETTQCSETERPRGFYHLLFVLNVSLYSVKLFPKQSTRFKVKDTFISSTVEEISTYIKKQGPKYTSKFTFSPYLAFSYSYN